LFKKVLIANRGTIACRIIRTLDHLGIGSVAIYSDADRHSLHVRKAAESVNLGGVRSYLDAEAVLEAARSTGAEAIHPGYGFLSENADFAEACERAGVAFIGPTPHQMREFGLKHRAKEIAAAYGVPLLPGTGLLSSWQDAAVVGFPLMLKSTAGGGGIGMRLCRTPEELEESFAAVQRQGATSFKDSGVFAERFVERARHIEVQIFGDGHGRVIALGERDCSAQRRNQKVIEETPAPGISAATREALFAAAVKLGEAVGYRNAGTVEFLYDSDREEFYFLEVNTRLQVEHGVTEELTGIDLVEWMIRLAAGENPIRAVRPAGASIQVRLYAESPLKDFQPSPGLLTAVKFPHEARVETWVESGTEVPPHYDPMVAKIIVRGDTREEAVAKLETALQSTVLGGIETNLDYLTQVVRHPEFREGGFPTSFLKRFEYEPRLFEVLEPGTQTTVQDFPGRLGHWDIGVPPSGPMDDLSFRLANELVGNPEDAAALELHAHRSYSEVSPQRACRRYRSGHGRAVGDRDHRESRPDPAFRSGERSWRANLSCHPRRDRWRQLSGKQEYFHPGQVRRPCRVRTLATGDLLRFEPDPSTEPAPAVNLTRFPEKTWEIGVTYGPHGAPDFFTERDIETFFTTDWRVHYNSDRTGVRLMGPKPEWARKDGGEAGLHPSNIHDNAYAVGTIDFTGDMPIILGPDGPSCGGFVCPATIISAERWKIGQLKAGDSVRFFPGEQPSRRPEGMSRSCDSRRWRPVPVSRVWREQARL
jgi:urea carboxylase